MYRYPALFEPEREAGGFLVTFPDFPWGVTQGDTIEEPKLCGKNITGCMPALAEAMAMRKTSVRKAELARRLGVQKSQIEHLLDLNNSNPVGSGQAAFHALGKRLSIEMKHAA